MGSHSLWIDAKKSTPSRGAFFCDYEWVLVNCALGFAAMGAMDGMLIASDGFIGCLFQIKLIAAFPT